jgi:hypothetical protein
LKSELKSLKKKHKATKARYASIRAGN